jgi:hypothetical protein
MLKIFRVTLLMSPRVFEPIGGPSLRIGILQVTERLRG